MTDALNIVIVEDNALIAMDLADLLIAMGHGVAAIASTEAEAVSAAERCQPDLMIVDANLAEGSGVAAMHKILAKRSVPYLYVTGDPSQVRQLAQDAIVVAKPFKIQDLSEAIAKAQSALSTTTSGIADEIV